MIDKLLETAYKDFQRTQTTTSSNFLSGMTSFKSWIKFILILVSNMPKRKIKITYLRLKGLTKLLEKFRVGKRKFQAKYSNIIFFSPFKKYSLRRLITWKHKYIGLFPIWLWCMIATICYYKIVSWLKGFFQPVFKYQMLK